VGRAGHVYLVGAGPGDPDLLTRKALRLLAEADVVIHDRLVSAEILAMARTPAVLLDAGKEPGQQDAIQQRIFDWLLEYSARGCKIVRLKSGDPMVFGRGGDELEFLAQHGIAAEIVPGVSSAIAAPGLAGIPLTQRGVAASFAVIAGHRQSVCAADWSIYNGVDTLVVLMGVEFRDVIAGSLMAHGERPADLPVAFVMEASTGRQRVVESTLGEVARRQMLEAVHSPAVMVIGEVVRLRARTSANSCAEVSV